MVFKIKLKGIKKMKTIQEFKNYIEDMKVKKSGDKDFIIFLNQCISELELNKQYNYSEFYNYINNVVLSIENLIDKDYDLLSDYLSGTENPILNFVSFFIHLLSFMKEFNEI